MGKSKIGVLGKDILYTRQFCEYISGKKSNFFDTFTFSSVNALIEHCKQEYLDILLISEDLQINEISKFNIGKILLLSEGNVVKEKDEFDSIYMYQSADAIVDEIIEKSEIQISADLDKHVNCEIIGVYSPINRCGKTTFSIGLCKRLSLQGKTLYINLEMFSGIRSMLEPSEYDISDLMYFYLQGENSLKKHFKNIITKVSTDSDVDCILPAVNSSEIKDVAIDKWENMIMEIASMGMYEYIVIDIGDGLANPWDLLGKCNKIYIPRLKNNFSINKIKEFETFLLRMNLEIYNRLVYLDIPISACIGENISCIRDVSWNMISKNMNVKELV